MIVVSDLYVKRGDFALINFEVPQGSILPIVGPNGPGKTTLLEAITGLQKVEKGRIIIDGVDVTRFPPERMVGYVPTDCVLFPHMTVCQNIIFGARKVGKWIRMSFEE